MFLYLAPKKAGAQKKSQQARDRERLKDGEQADAIDAEATDKKKQERDVRRDAVAPDIDLEMPANGGLLANAKISAEALRKLSESKDEEE